jgi:outer membrane protein assembly factor BamB
MNFSASIGVMLSSVVFTLLTTPASANWPDWRGPTGQGQVEGAHLPLIWSETRNIVWKTPIHDLGYSTPVVWEDRIWITTATEDGKSLYAVGVDVESGEVVHDIKVFDVPEPQDKHDNNSYATPSAAIEEERVYVHFGTHGTACLDTQKGETIWSRTDLNCEHMQGPVSSPVLYNNLLILHFEGTDVQYIVALDKTTGENVWRYDRPKDLYDQEEVLAYKKAYQTPVFVEVDGKTQMISNGALMVTGHEPETGQVIWSVRYGHDSTISRILSGEGLFFVNCGGAPNRTQLWAIRQGGAGDVTDTHVVWKMDKDVPHESSPVLVDGLLYLMSDRGVLICKEAATGEEVWQEELRDRHGASVLAGDGKIYLFSKEGRTTVIKPGRAFEKLAENQLEGGFWASPAVAGNSLILRTKTHLYRVEEK